MNFDCYLASMEVVRLLGEIDEFKGAWRSLANISPERLANLKKIATIESIGSSTRIEGASLSDEQVEQLLSGIMTYSFKSRDEEEVAGYASVMDTVFANWQNIPFTENYIKQLHGDLLKFSEKDNRHRGRYKTLPNRVEAFDGYGNSLGIIFDTASPFETPFKMTELVGWTKEALGLRSVHPLFAIAVFNVSFLAIHPFQDGNGRLSRILTTLLLLQAGYAYVPYTSLESVIEANKEKYYLALRRTQSSLAKDSPDWESWLLFFLQAMQKQKARLEEKLKREKLLQGDLPILATTILELVRQNGRLKSSDIEKLTGESRSTIRLRLNELVQKRHLKRHGQSRATWYTVFGTDGEID